jgi:hypothetical protein
MTPGDRAPIDRARDLIAARISDEHPGWIAGHGLYGWHARRLDDGREVRAAGPDGLRALIGAAPPSAAPPFAAPPFAAPSFAAPPFCAWNASGCERGRPAQ